MALAWLLLLAWAGRCDAQGIATIDTKGVLRGYLDQEAAIETQVEQDEELEPTDAKEVAELKQRIAEREKEERVKEAEEEAEAEAEEEEFTDVDLSESLMLLGSILFIMMLFYLVNDPDKDMKYYSWSVISATLSIFSAVLIFSGVNQLIHSYLLPEGDGGMKLLLGLAELLIYFLLLQVGTAYESGAFKEVPADQTRETLAEKEKKIEQRTKCWATIMAHITGFASIHCGTVLQNFDFFRQTAAASFLAAPSLFLLSVALGWVARRVRQRAKDLQDAPATKGKYQQVRQNEHVDDEKWREWTYDLWDEYVMDAELDAAALSVSFLVVQSCRFAFSGFLPPGFGPIQSVGSDVGYETRLTSFSLVFVLLTVILVMVTRRVFGGEPIKPGTWKSLLRRCLLLLQLTAAMALAWTLLFSAQWEIGRYSKYLGPPTALASRITLALGISFLAAMVTRMLDCIQDSEYSGEEADKALGYIIDSLGILVGFSWEQSFDGGVEVLAARTPRPQQTQLGLAVAVVLLLLPAWRRYILATVISLEKERRQKEEPAHSGGSRLVAK